MGVSFCFNSAMEDLNLMSHDEFQRKIQSMPESVRWQLIKKRSEGQYAAFRSKYFNDPSAFIDECTDFELKSYQREILDSFADKRTVSVRSLHSAGKSFTSACIAVWFSLTRDVDYDFKLAILAPSHRQLVKYWFPELWKILSGVHWHKIGREKPQKSKDFLQAEWRLSTGEVMAIASNDHQKIEGLHASEVCVLIDEAKGLADSMFDAMSGATQSASQLGPEGDRDRNYNGERAYLYCSSTPGGPIGRFFEIQSNKDGAFSEWHLKHITVEEVLAAGRITQAAIDRAKARWGENSSIYRSKILGEFTEETGDGLVPIAWVDAAFERWKEIKEDQDGDFGYSLALGVDIAGRGKDKTKVAHLHKRGISHIEEIEEEDTLVQASIVRSRALSKACAIVADEVAIGEGFVSKLKQLDAPVIPFNGQWKSELTDETGAMGFTNMRTACYWHVRKLLDPMNGHNIALPPNDDLLFELTSVRYEIKGDKIKLEPKLDFKKRIKRSPDTADCVVYAFSMLVLENEAMERHAVKQKSTTIRAKSMKTPMIGTSMRSGKFAYASGADNRMGFETHTSRSRRGRRGW